MEATAAELFRVVLFTVHYAEIWLLGGIPYIGRISIEKYHVMPDIHHQPILHSNSDIVHNTSISLYDICYFHA